MFAVLQLSKCWQFELRERNTPVQCSLVQFKPHADPSHIVCTNLTSNRRFCTYALSVTVKWITLPAFLWFFFFFPPRAEAINSSFPWEPCNKKNHYWCLNKCSISWSPWHPGFSTNQSSSDWMHSFWMQAQITTDFIQPIASEKQAAVFEGWAETFEVRRGEGDREAIICSLYSK